jgi:undecaprenyl-diphosphatase
LIAEKWLPRQSDLFNIVIQSAAVLAVIPLFKPRIQRMLHAAHDPAARDFVAKVAVAFGITGAGGLVLEKLHFKLPEELFPVGMALLVGGVVFVIVESRVSERRWSHDVSWRVAIAFGLGQLVAAVFPGASRSGTTIMLALLMGLSRPAATEFSFLVGIPTMLAAGGLKIFKALSHGAPPENWAMVGLGTIVSAVVSFIAVKWLLRFVQSHTFIGFGYYRIIVGAGVLVGGLFGLFGPAK